MHLKACDLIHFLQFISKFHTMKTVLKIFILFTVTSLVLSDFYIHWNTRHFDKKWICQIYVNRAKIQVEVGDTIYFNTPCAVYTCLPNYVMFEKYCTNVNRYSSARYPYYCQIIWFK